MATLNSVLKKLNKGKAEEDAIRFASEQPEGYFKKKKTPTGSIFLNKLLGGGYAKGGYNTIIADGGVGKSSIALMAIREEYLDTGRIGVFYDGEGTLDESYMVRMGVTRDMIIHIKSRNLEKMLDEVEAFSTAEEVGVIIIDSIPIFTATSVEEKGAGDYNMAVEARKYSQRMPIIEGNAMNRDITLIGLTSYKLDPSAMGDPRKLTRGLWQYTMSNVILDLTKKSPIFDKCKNEIGHLLHVRVKKTKSASYDPKKAHDINFYYDGGFNMVEDYTSLFIETDVVHKAGGWFSFPDEDGVEIKVQGRDKVVEHLKENEITFNHLIERYEELGGNN